MLLLVAAAGPRADALLSSVQPADREDYQAVASTRSWSTAPSGPYRIYLDIYDNADFFDSEPGGTKFFADKTVLSDTLRPVVTVLWERFRFQAGVIAQRTFGDSTGVGSVNPWAQILWKPTPALSTVLGNLSIPHEYLPILFYEPNYFLVENHETGLQLLHRQPGWRDDFFFNYHQTETAGRNEKFDLGYVHHNEWKLFNFNYQAHWQHAGGDNFPHPADTINDSAQAAGVGLKHEVLPALILGANFYYLHSHLRVDSDTPGMSMRVNGNGRYWQAFARWSRLKLVYAHWHGRDFSHADGDEYFKAPNMHQGTIHYDLLLSDDFTLFGELTGYFVGNNSLGITHYVKPTFLIQGAWHFAIPSKGWDIGPTAAASDSAVPSRWDTGL